MGHKRWPVAGKTVLLTGAAGGIGAATTFPHLPGCERMARQPRQEGSLGRSRSLAQGDSQWQSVSPISRWPS